VVLHQLALVGQKMNKIEKPGIKISEILIFIPGFSSSIKEFRCLLFFICV
jgi:hypothetical protein